ncbi:hypothetical protein [Pseudonocardia phyllosphaerae]|uniref:hypothetical protein n=1 Tax=Pseudonocardia phyllosphaerae TaxID=3390502 RepID=UPI00397919F0
MEQFELRLTGTGLPPGEITFAGIAAVAEAMQRLSGRVGRHLTGHDGRGRSPGAVARATEFRLQGTDAGSTVLRAVIGEDGVLGEGLEHESLDALFDIFRGVASQQPPDWITPLLGETTVDVVEALAAVSDRCSVSSPAGRAAPIEFIPGAVHRDSWLSIPRAASLRRSDVSVSGRLDLVDLRRELLRVRDAVGNEIRLEDVVGVDDASRLIGQQVTATGEAVLGSRGQVTMLVGARIEQLDMPDWTAPEMPDLGPRPARTDGAVGGLDVDDDEVSAFLELIGR